MQPGGRNPIRRSKMIGQTQGGRVKDGRTREKRSRIFTRTTWEKLSRFDNDLRIIRENPSRDYFHPCTPDEIQHLIDHHLRKKDVAHIKAIILRRTPKYDEQRGIDARARWNCIILNAMRIDRRMYFDGKRLGIEKRHYAPWCNRWIREKERWILLWTDDELKRYYLYHLFFHELGHLVDPIILQRSHREREEFAENYALEWARKMKVI